MQCVSVVVAISSLVVKLLKKCRVRWRVGHTVVLDPLSTSPYDKSWLHDRYLRLFREWVRCLRLPIKTRDTPAITDTAVDITLRGHTPALTRINEGESNENLKSYNIFIQLHLRFSFDSPSYIKTKLLLLETLNVFRTGVVSRHPNKG